MKRKGTIVAGVYVFAGPVSTILLGLLLFAPAARGQETLLEVFGGAGGRSVRADCEPGSYVVGFKGRAGDWMDQISIVCGRWNEKTQTLQSAAQGEVKGPFGDSTGGDELSESCPDGWAVSAYDIRTTLEEWNSSVNVKNYRAKFLHGIRFYCRPAIAGSGQAVHKTLGSWSTGDVSRFWGTWSCPPRELATGMHGRAGLFVDALGLICNLRPEPATVGVETKPHGEATSPGPLQGTELKKGPLVDPGNLIPKEPVGKQEPAPAPTPPAQPPAGGQTATVIADVDVYQLAGGGGKHLGVLNSNNSTTKVSLVEPCQNNWFHVKGDPVPDGEGWVYSGKGGDDYKSLDLEPCQ